MSEVKKYQRKKNLLIVLFLFLLVVFVCIMCAIFIYAKNNPPQKFISPDSIEIKQMQKIDYNSSAKQGYIKIPESTVFKVMENGEELNLIVTEDRQINIVREDYEDSIEIMNNENNINNNIKLIYQTATTSLILTETGELYRLTDNEIFSGKLNVEQILNNMHVEEVVQFTMPTDSIYVLNSENKLINTDNSKEYNGIIDSITTSTSTIYIYENGAFGLEEGKMFINENNEILKIKISFDNKIIDENDKIYEINTTDNTISTSNLGEFKEVGYSKNIDDSSYKIKLQSNTGYYDFVSSYYYP